jgi:glycosyltransferase involved in cell wall biosynthesis
MNKTSTAQPLTCTRRSPTGAPHGRPLRIAMIAPPYYEVPPRGYGGVEAVVADLIDGLLALGHHITLIGAGEPGTDAEFVQIWPQPMATRLGEAVPEVLHAAAVRRVVEGLIAGPGLDLVHDHTLAGPLNAPVYADAGVPTVVTMHGPVEQDLRQLYSILDGDIHLVAISERQRQLAPELPWAGRVHNAVRVGTFPFRADKGDYALFLGRFHPQKAPHLALDAAHQAGMPLLLAGKCSESIEVAYFDREVRPRLRSSDRLLGEADAATKRQLLAQARCLLFPIQWEEPFGMVMIEAMACGTPVVALRHGSVPEIVADGITGYVCDGPEQLPDALARVGQLDPHACRHHVEAHFDLDALATGYERIYHTIVAANRAKTSHLDPLATLRHQHSDVDAELDQHYRQLYRRRTGHSPQPSSQPDRAIH